MADIVTEQQCHNVTMSQNYQQRIDIVAPLENQRSMYRIGTPIQFASRSIGSGEGVIKGYITPEESAWNTFYYLVDEHGTDDENTWTAVREDEICEYRIITGGRTNWSKRLPRNTDSRTRSRRKTRP